MAREIKANALVTGFRRGNHLIKVDSFEESIEMLQTALGSNLISDVDITAQALPRNSTAMGSDDFWPDQSDWFAQMRPYKVSADGILTIPVRGILMHGVSITYGKYFTGYEYLVRAIQRGIADMSVKGIVFHVDSPGGHVAGCFDLCDLIYSLEKPTVAFVADQACSAAYAISASCKKIIATQTCDVGNIGVLTGLVDYTKMLDDAGVKYYYISAPEGGLKADGHFGAGVSQETLDDLQASANETYAIFVNCVARNRPLTPEQIIETKALSFRKEASLAMGFIDMVASSVDILGAAGSAFANLESDGDADDQPGETMKTAPVIEDVKMTEEEKAKMQADAKAEGIREGQVAAAKRISDILGSPEAVGREDLAKHLAFNTDMAAEGAVATLTVSAKVATAAPVTPEKDGDKNMQKSFDEQMSKNAPNLTPNSNDDSNKPEDKAASSVAASMALARRAGIGGYNSPEKAN